LALFQEIHPDLRPTYYALVLATLVNQSQRIIIQSMLPLYAGAYLQLSSTEIGLLFSISGVIVFAMIIPAGFVMDRVGRKWCTVPSTAIPALIRADSAAGIFQLAILVGFAGISQDWRWARLRPPRTISCLRSRAFAGGAARRSQLGGGLGASILAAIHSSLRSGTFFWFALRC
jgi:MFS family permease